MANTQRTRREYQRDIRGLVESLGDHQGEDQVACNGKKSCSDKHVADNEQQFKSKASKLHEIVAALVTLSGGS